MAAVRNRSAPPSAVVPVVVYDDVRAAVEWLTTVLGFVEHVQIGDHRSQLGIGDGAVIVADATNGRRAPAVDGDVTHSVMIRVADVDAHHRAAVENGADRISEPTDHPYGERQYSVRDFAGHVWTFSQSVADVAPETWGGATATPW